MPARAARACIAWLRRSPPLSDAVPRHWVACCAGAVLIGLAAIALDGLADRADHVRQLVEARNPHWMLLLAPAGLALSSWLTRTAFAGAQGSGIPQTFAAHLFAAPGFAASRPDDDEAIGRLLSPRLAIARMLLTVLGLLAGASIGHTGPTVQAGASIMQALARALHLSDPTLRRALILAGVAAGFSAAFDTPLGGIMFAFEALGRPFEARAAGTVLVAVILSAATGLALAGSGPHLSHGTASLPIGFAWEAVLACGLLGGLAGGLFGTLLVRVSAGLPGLAGRLVRDHPVWLAACCGLLLALIGLVAHGTTYGTGLVQTRALADGTADLGTGFFAWKFLASLISFCSGIPGGVFSPSLSVGAGLGGAIATCLPHSLSGAVVLLGIAAYFAALVQAPLTATVIVAEMAGSLALTPPLLATSLLAFGISRLICRRPPFRMLAESVLQAAGHGRDAPEGLPP